MEAGLTLVSAFDNGSILRTADLSFDLTAYRSDVMRAVSEAFSLSLEAGYITPEVAPRMLGKAVNQALALADGAGFLETGTVEHVLRRAVFNATILNRKIPPAGNP